jgi:hypothetical protein
MSSWICSVFDMAEYMHTFHSDFRCVAKLQKATSFVISLSVLPVHMNNLAPAGQILMKCDIEVFLENASRKFKFY